MSTRKVRKKKPTLAQIRARMENIISNGGKFDPYKGAHAVPSE